MNREQHLQKTFPLEDGTTYIQSLDKSFRYCQSQIEDNGMCETQCEHCKEYYRPLILLTERERYDWLRWECGKRGVGIKWDRMALPAHKWFDNYHTYNEETKDIVVPQTIEECDVEFVNLLDSIKVITNSQSQAEGAGAGGEVEKGNFIDSASVVEQSSEDRLNTIYEKLDRDYMYNWIRNHKNRT